MKKKTKKETVKKDNHLFYIIIQITILMILVLLFAIYFYVKQIVPSALYTQQASIMQSIMFDFENYTLISTSNCGENCIVFEWKEQSQVKLKVNKDTISYGDTTVKLSYGSYFDNIKVTSKTIDNTSGKDSYLIVDLPIKSNITSGNYGVYAVYQYDSNYSAIHGSDFNDTNSITNSPIRLLGDTEVLLSNNETYQEKGWLIYNSKVWSKGDLNNPLGVTVTYSGDVNKEDTTITYTITNDTGTYTRTRTIKRK